MPVNDILSHRQGYFIFSSNDFPNIVFLRGNNSTGNFYAALTAVQLFDKTRPVFNNARIIDYPDFENRQFLIGNISDSISTRGYFDQLMNYKMNGAFLSYNSSDTSALPRMQLRF
jgi:hypothetical protein